MWDDLTTMGIPVLDKVVRTVVVYLTIVALFRFTGKRGLANLNTFDFVVIFLLSNVVQNAVIGDDDSLLGGMIGAVTLIAVNAALNRWLVADDHLARLLEGTPTTVIRDGRVVEKAARHLVLRRAELEHAVRLQTGGGIGGVALGRLEPDGRLVIVPKPEEAKATRADIDRLERRLAAIEDLLRSGASGTGSGGR
ncbi:MAG TPA: YetF domain-containing protein [Streptomyces sp.]|uniref:DUF421 domain-containing protein n=1 Tax=Streptomyces sp. TaxID=1931 RepID=UPI002D2367EE|nr:YetF domain-containing protein [Streptomyces sp.]HZG06672.1 YetF domain-containing protein [Streptomyces sp.]